MIYILVITLTITVISIILLLSFIWHLLKEHTQLKAENEELVAANQRLLADQAMKPNWIIGSLSKEPGQSNKK